MFKNLINSSQQNDYISELEQQVATQQRKIEKYEKKLKDLVVAYRSVCEERDVLSQLISTSTSTNATTDSNGQLNHTELVVLVFCTEVVLKNQVVQRKCL